MSKVLRLCVALGIILKGSIIFGQDRGAASSIAWSPDGDTIAVGSTTGVWFFDSEFNDFGYVSLKHSEGNSPRSLDWNSVGDRLAVAYPSVATESPVQIIDTRTLEVITDIYLPDLSSPVIWHPEANLLISGDYAGNTYLMDAHSGETLISLYVVSGGRDVYWHEPLTYCWIDNTTVFLVTPQRSYVVDIEEKTVLQEVSIDPPLIRVTCNRDYEIISSHGRLVNLRTGSNSKLFDGGFFPDNSDIGFYTLAMAWSPQSEYIAASSEGCRVRIFDSRSGELMAELSGGVFLEQLAFTFFGNSIAWHPDGSQFAVVGQFGDIRVWDAETYALLQRFDGFELHPDILASLISLEEIDSVKCP